MFAVFTAEVKADDFDRFFLDLVRAAADRPTRPRWNADSFFRRFAPR